FWPRALLSICRMFMLFSFVSWRGFAMGEKVIPIPIGDNPAILTLIVLNMEQWTAEFSAGVRHGRCRQPRRPALLRHGGEAWRFRCRRPRAGRAEVSTVAPRQPAGGTPRRAPAAALDAALHGHRHRCRPVPPLPGHAGGGRSGLRSGGAGAG